MDIVVLAGGLSAERDVSLKSGDTVTEALRKRGHRVILLDAFLGITGRTDLLEDPFSHERELSVSVGSISDTAPDLSAVRASRQKDEDVYFGPQVLFLCRRADFVFLALHGGDGENGRLQAALDLFGIRYSGCDYKSSALAMDKGMTKILYERSGIPTPKGFTLARGSAERELKSHPLFFPCVVKPSGGGSSIGVSIVQKEEEFSQALAEAFAREDEVTVEEYIKGREFSVGVLDGHAFPVIEIAPKEGFYDYQNKYKAGRTLETCPADLPEEVSRQMRAYAQDAADSLGLSVYSRTDFLLDESGRMAALESNALPGMTPTSLLPQEAAAEGMSFGRLCEKIIEVSLKKYDGE